MVVTFAVPLLLWSHCQICSGGMSEWLIKSSVDSVIVPKLLVHTSAFPILVLVRVTRLVYSLTIFLLPFQNPHFVRFVPFWCVPASSAI